MSLRNAFLIILLPLLLYLPPIWNSDFVALDDELLIVDNPTAHALSWDNLQKAFTSYDPELYIPLTLLTYQIDYKLWGLNPVGFHLTNLILHIGNALLVMGLVWFLLCHGERSRTMTHGTVSHFDYAQCDTVRYIALLSALLFAIHPLNTEAVMWASARKDLLMGFFLLLSTYLYVFDRKKLSLCTFLLACLAKVTAVTLPLILLIVDLLQQKPINRANLQNKTPYFLLSIVFILIALFGKQAQTSFVIPLLISFVAIPFSLSKFVFPINLSIFYPFTDDVVWTHPHILIGMSIIVAISIATWMIRKRSNLPLFTWIAFLLLLAPSLTNVLKGGGYDTLDVYITSDRYMYLPIIALLPLSAYLLTRKPLLYLTPIIILILSYATFLQAKTWDNSETLFAHAIAAQKNPHVAFTNLAGIYAQNGDLKKALELYENAKVIKPTWRTLFNLGQIYGSLERYTDAINTYRELLMIRPDYAEALAQLGGLLLRAGHVQEALLHLERARTLDPNLASVHYNLGLIYEHGGNQIKSRESFERVLELNPSDAQAQKKLQKF